VEDAREQAKVEMFVGTPPYLADMLLDAYEAAVGIPAFLSNAFAVIAGPPPGTFFAWAQYHAADFALDA
jgi:hypothetical protein